MSFWIGTCFDIGLGWLVMFIGCGRSGKRLTQREPLWPFYSGNVPDNRRGRARDPPAIWFS